MNDQCPVFPEGHRWRYQTDKSVFEFVTDPHMYRRVEYAIHACSCAETIKVVIHNTRTDHVSEPLVVEER